MGPHRVQAFAACAQLESFFYELRLRKVISDPAPFIGTVYHVLAAYWYAALLEPKPAWYVYPDPWTAARTLGAARMDLVAEAERLFAAYIEKWPRGADPWRPVLVEFQFVSHAEGEPYSTRVDMLAWEDTVGHVLTNFKTAARPTNAASYIADRQVLTEIAESRAAGYDVQRFYIAETVKSDPPDPRRVPIGVSALMYSRLARDTGYYLRERQRVIAEYPDPWDRPRNMDACRGRFRICDFWPLCSDGPARIHEYVQEAT